MRLSLIIVMSLAMFQLSAQQFNVSDEAITFPNGKKVDNPVNSPLPIPDGGNNSHIYAEFSDGITGDITHNDYLGDVELFGFNNHIFRETDAAGRPNPGNPMKDPFIFYKKIDQTSADLLQKLAVNGTISEITIKMVNADINNFLTTNYSIKLSNVKVVKHRYICEFDPISGLYYFYEKFNLYTPQFEFKDFDTNQTITVN